MQSICQMSDRELRWTRFCFFNVSVCSVLKITVLSADFTVLETHDRLDGSIRGDNVCSCKLIIDVYILLSTKETVGEYCDDDDCKQSQENYEGRLIHNLKN